jgi:predicted transcriptional regulator of viral defense system
MSSRTESEPNWDLLLETIREQHGFFTGRQAAAAAFSPVMLSYHVRTGRFQRPFRGVYRLALYPSDEHEDLLILWLATDLEGVFSHETALNLHQLSDALPARAHISLPKTWKRRALPDPVERHYALVDERDRAWVGPLPVTSPARTLRDCITAHTSPELVAQAFKQAVARGLLAPQIAEQIRVEAPQLYRGAMA